MYYHELIDIHIIHGKMMLYMNVLRYYKLDGNDVIIEM